jgi:iron complex outermembrane recepter protein
MSFWLAYPIGSKNTVFLAFGIILSLIIGICPISAAARNDKGTGVSGVVVTSDGQPAPGVSVYLQELQKGTQTGTNGDFAFRNIAPGEYHLVVSMMGFEKISQTVTVTQGNVTHLKIALQESSLTLDEVTITGGGNRFATKESDDVSKMALRSMENPQV